MGFGCWKRPSFSIYSWDLQECHSDRHKSKTACIRSKVLTPPTMSIAELESSIAPQSSIDVVTIAQAHHWFDLPNFYQQAKWVLKKPHGIISAWCYTVPEVNESVDAVFQPY